MFKFFIYLFLFYVVFRLLFGKMTGSVRTKVFRFDNRQPAPEKETKQQDGSITINPKIKPKGNDKNIGEYVDYEEIK